MTQEHRFELIANVASSINEPLDIPGLSEEFEQIALQFSIAQILQLIPEQFGDMILQFLASLPSESLVNFLKWSLPAWLKIVENKNVEALGRMLSFAATTSSHPSSLLQEGTYGFVPEQNEGGWGEHAVQHIKDHGFTAPVKWSETEVKTPSVD